MKSAAISEMPSIHRNVAMRDTSGQDRVLDRAPTARRRLWIGLGVAVVLLGAASGSYPALKRWAGAEASVPLERLRLASVTRGEFVRDVSVRGTVVAAVSPTMFAPADGTVTLLFEAGDSVSRSEVVARIDSPEITNQLQQEQATYQSLEIGLERQAIEKKKTERRNQQTIDMAGVTITAAERELRRAEASREHQVISRQDYEKAADDLAKARLEYEHARQNAKLESESLAFELRTRALQRDRQGLLVKNLERRVDELGIRSPVDGMIGTLAVDQKAAVSRNQPLMTVVDLTAFEIDIQVPEAYGDDLALGMPAEIAFGGDNYPGTITAISPEVRNNQVTGRVRFDGEVPEGLRQNQRVSARVVLESKRETLMVQRGPFLDSGSGRIAYLVEDQVAVRRPIRIGSASIGQVEILEGLATGDTIIISSLAQFDGAETVFLSD